MNLDNIKTSLLKTENNSEPIDFQEFMSILNKLKEDALAGGNQVEAKRIWCFESIVKIRKAYNESFDLLKKEKFYDAWCVFERIENLIGHLMPHIASVGENRYKIDIIASQVSKFQFLFPYKIFISPEFVNIEKYCSVCKKRIALRNHCGHRVGEIYDGEMCYRIIKNVKVAGTALTENPSQKYSVPFLIDPKTNESIDQYNYKTIQFISRRLLSPYSEWSFETHTFLGEIESKFKTTKRNDLCPCESNKKYKQCCIDKSRKRKEHIRFHVNDFIDVSLPTFELPD